MLLPLEDLGGPEPLSLSHISGLLFPEVAQHGNKFSFLSAVKFNCFVFKKVINLKLFWRCSHHMNMNEAFHGVLTYKLRLPIWMATTGARILFTDWFHLCESDFTDSGWSSDIVYWYEALWCSLRQPGRIDLMSSPMSQWMKLGSMLVKIIGLYLLNHLLKFSWEK